MATVRLLLVAALVALPLWVALSMPAYACSCVPDSFEPGAQAARSDLIVIGTVADIRLVNPIALLPTPASPTEHAEPMLIPQADVDWTVSVEEYIKGTGPNTIEVRSNTSVTVASDELTIHSGTNSLCGFAPELEARLLLYLSGAGRYTTSACAGNWEIVAGNEAAVRTRIEELRAALNAQTPLPPSLPPTGTGPQHHGAPVVPLAIATALAALGLAANAAFAPRRRS